MMENLNEELSKIKNLMKINETTTTFGPPISGSLYVTSPFGAKRSYEIHPGVDLRAKSGTQILSPADGVILLADPNNNKLCGGTLDIQFPDGFWGRFCHVKSFNVKKGDRVKKGDVLGLSGGDRNDPGAGNSKNAHIHFTLKKDGTKVDPMNYINKATISGSNILSANGTEKDLVDLKPEEKSQLNDLVKILDSDFDGDKIGDLLGVFDGDTVEKEKGLFDTMKELSSFWGLFKK